MYLFLQSSTFVFSSRERHICTDCKLSCNCFCFFLAMLCFLCLCLYLRSSVISVCLRSGPCLTTLARLAKFREQMVSSKLPKHTIDDLKDQNKL
ncbi:hypothetical protein HanPSC8_Chr06g0251351 [Helianthus annuus]|nr:hypothetical protein HanPSC8_Chr06g0251351 [Helianthus annuus]